MMTAQSEEELPRVLKDLLWILENISICNKSKDMKGLGKWTTKLRKWRDNHPQEAEAVAKQLILRNEMKQETSP